MTRDADNLLCKVVTIQGDEFTLQAERSWKIWNLKMHVYDETRIPEYEQHFAHKTTKLLSDDTLSDLLPSCDEDQLTLTLVRSGGPECIPKSQKVELWEAFLAFSHDSGDTMDGAQVAQVARMGGMFRASELVPYVANIPDSVTFLELLAILAALWTPEDAPRTEREEDPDALIMELGRSRYAPRRQVDESNGAGAEAEHNAGDGDSTEASSDFGIVSDQSSDLSEPRQA
eukprot:TRINITY_DN9421_c0_g1_i1.p1 TRINITY_DN9421_c0_g1~~TRINITY_DN9421_c0_g1_i1.p1  ORF type:complete len:247 (+),score=26.55 TRINITY_DN9421_c0_g1_i1:53-742(+)